jgi:hypothetical protein
MRTHRASAASVAGAVVFCCASRKDSNSSGFLRPSEVFSHMKGILAVRASSA